MINPKVTILIPNYKTPELTKLCLRLLRKYTDPKLAHCIVIDNDSQDASVEYLKNLTWVEFIPRAAIAGEGVLMSHARALDLGLERVTTPYVLSIHTDTLVKDPEWLPFLLSKIENQAEIAGVGSWKLESKPLLRRWLKFLEKNLQRHYYQLIGQSNHALEGTGKNYYYLRSHCALYRTDLIRQIKTNFGDGNDTAGKVMHQKLVSQGYKMLFLPSEILGQYLDHINHATMVLNPELGARKTTITKGHRRLEKRWREINAEKILRDTALDY